VSTYSEMKRKRGVSASPEPESMQKTPKWTSKAVMRPVTGAAALHVLLMRVGFAQDAYEVFGWTAHTVFTRAEMHEKWTEFGEGMAYDQVPVWRTQPKVVRKAYKAVRLGAYHIFIWAMGIVAARLELMEDLSDNETDMEA
jgi:hypothetical protein